MIAVRAFRVVRDRRDPEWEFRQVHHYQDHLISDKSKEVAPLPQGEPNADRSLWPAFSRRIPPVTSQRGRADANYLQRGDVAGSTFVSRIFGGTFFVDFWYIELGYGSEGFEFRVDSERDYELDVERAGKRGDSYRLPQRWKDL